MTVVAVVERPLPLRYLRTSDPESGTVSCEVDEVPVGCWVGTECLCPLEAVLVVVLTSALTWATTVELAILGQVEALLPSPLESFEELLLSG